MKTNYKKAIKKVEELLKKTEGIDSMDHPDMIQLDHYSNIVADYEEQKFLFAKPLLVDVIKQRMYEMGLKHTGQSHLRILSRNKIPNSLLEDSQSLISGSMQKKIALEDGHCSF